VMAILPSHGDVALNIVGDLILLNDCVAVLDNQNAFFVVLVDLIG
jgi:hypothetical protein